MKRDNASDGVRGRKVLRAISNLTFFGALAGAFALGTGLHLREATIALNEAASLAPRTAEVRRQAVDAVLREWEGKRIERVAASMGLVLHAPAATGRQRTVWFGSLRLTFVDGRLAAVD